ncbi:HxxPF-repeated domain-containing protein [Actinacidiphila yanglinensis]|uniref:HxxPF-repeated domain-containing protein n=1 Tax=Actinacidiphila yanglinensis TaxID=310779 RepID=A0A1H6E916_9ACTN|nr:condensation domain-containing protein [Actinacidiphila yanglinensis]SEG94202.1 HxxPF-repeated domain-containing protein [Actinacidiphila yanglinensis]
MSGARTRRELVVEAWRAVLEVEPAGDDEDFFDAGGNSILLVMLQRELSERLGHRVPLSRISADPTLAGLSALEDGPAADAAVRATPFPRDDGRPAPLAHSQERLWLQEQFTPGHVDGTIELAYLLAGDWEPERLERALLRVVEHHPVLRTIYPIDADDLEVSQVVRPTAELVLEQRPTEALSGAVPPLGPGDQAGPGGPEALEAVAAGVFADWWETPFDLEAAPPLRARLCALGDGRHLLCLQVHHLAFDGWSERRLIDDLAAAYRGEELRPVPVGYASYSRWERSEAAQWLESDLPFWRDRLSRPPRPFLPAPGTAEGERREAEIGLDRDTVGRLTRVAASYGGPPGAALAAAVGRAVSGAFGVPDVCLGTVTAGRSVTALEPVVGCFVNPVALVLGGVCGQSPGESMRSTAEALTSAMEHGRTPFDELVRLLGPDRERHPWFQTWVVLQNEPPRAHLGEAMWLDPVRVPKPRTGLDLVVEAIPRPDGGWRVLVAWRADVVAGSSAEALRTELRAAFGGLADLA